MGHSANSNIFKIEFKPLSQSDAEMLLLNTMYQVEQEYTPDPDQFKEKADEIDQP